MFHLTSQDDCLAKSICSLQKGSFCKRYANKQVLVLAISPTKFGRKKPPFLQPY